MEQLTTLFLNQLLGLAWIRCLIEEGVDFINKYTGLSEKNEKIIYQSFENKSGLFDLPSAKASPEGLEKNILELIGYYLIFSTNPDIHQIIKSETFKQLVKDKIDKVRSKIISY